MSVKRKLVTNFLSLSTIQGLNYILPFITLPYLVRIFGPSEYGVIAFAQSFSQFLIIISDYGFNLSATKQIALSTNNREKISRVFSSVLYIKFSIVILGFFILFCAVNYIPKFQTNSLIFILFYGIVIGNSLIPTWLFQGIQKMKYITVINVVSKSIFAIGIFVFVKSKQDILLVPLINSIGYIIAGLIGILIPIVFLNVRFRKVSLIELKFQIADGWHIFISTLATSLYTVCNTLILGMFTNSLIVGYYASAEKLINACISLIQPLSQTVYPHINQLMNKSKCLGLRFIEKLLRIVGISTLIISLIVFFYSKEIIQIYLGNGYTQSAHIFAILSFLPFLIGISNILGTQTMLSLGYKKAFSNVLILASAINIILLFILVPIYGAYGTAFSVLTSELFVAIAMLVYLNNKKIYLLYKPLSRA